MESDLEKDIKLEIERKAVNDVVKKEKERATY